MTKQRLFSDVVTIQTINTCPICRNSSSEFWSYIGGVPHFAGWCPVCTNVRINHKAVDDIKRVGKAHLLSAYLRDLPAEAWDKLAFIHEGNVEKLADSVSAVPLVDQFDRLLFRVCEMTPRFGAPSSFSYEVDWPTIRARDSNEALEMLWALRAEGYLGGRDLNATPIPPIPTRKAFERYSEMQKAGPMSQQAFVAMAFAAEYDAAWSDIIKPGIEAAGYLPFRVDQKEHADKIDDLIMAEIRRSKFLVADFSGQRGGVYFEAGFAHGLGRPVIWMCRANESDRLHFDTRQYNHLLYDDPSLARQALTNRIVAILGEGTYKPIP